MKISNSKKQLAKIINENGGWREGAEFSAQDSSRDQYPGRVCFYRRPPTLRKGSTRWLDGGRGVVGNSESCITEVNVLSNWHQTILSRDEYFYLYPAPAKAVVESPEQRAKLAEIYKPSIEQLAAEYRNAKDYAGRKQQEADAAKADAEAKLAAYVAAAGSAVGLVLSVGVPELVITDWRDLQVGDEIEVFNFECPSDAYKRKAELGSGPCVVMSVGGGVLIELKSNLPKKGPYWDATGVDACEFRFIRRPTKEAPDA